MNMQNAALTGQKMISLEDVKKKLFPENLDTSHLKKQLRSPEGDIRGQQALKKLLRREFGLNATEEQVKTFWKDLLAELFPPGPEKPVYAVETVIVSSGERTRGNSNKGRTYQSRTLKGAESWVNYVDDIFGRRNVSWWRNFFLQHWQNVVRLEKEQRSDYAAVWHGLLKERTQQKAAERRLARQRYAACWRAFYEDYWAQQAEEFRKGYIGFWKTELQKRDTLKRLLRPKALEDVGVAYQGEINKPVASVVLVKRSKRPSSGKSPRRRSVLTTIISDIVYTERWVKDFMAGRCIDSQGLSYADYLLELMSPDAVVQLLYSQLSAPDFRAWAEMEKDRGFFVIPAFLLPGKSAKAPEEDPFDRILREAEEAQAAERALRQPDESPKAPKPKKAKKKRESKLETAEKSRQQNELNEKRNSLVKEDEKDPDWRLQQEAEADAEAVHESMPLGMALAPPRPQVSCPRFKRGRTVEKEEERQLMTEIWQERQHILKQFSAYQDNASS